MTKLNATGKKVVNELLEVFVKHEPTPSESLEILVAVTSMYACAVSTKSEIKQFCRELGESIAATAQHNFDRQENAMKAVIARRIAESN